jgi:predicted kinase
MLTIVAGVPGSGKSFFAERLAARIQADYINSDQVRIFLEAQGKYLPEDKMAVYREMLQQATQAIQARKDVVVDATFYHHTFREMFVQRARDLDQKIHVIEVVADEELIRERLKTPRKFSEADFQVYEKIRDEFEEITMPHLTLESKASNIEDMLSQAEKYVCGEAT